jgi:hypothetical protein
MAQYRPDLIRVVGDATFSLCRIETNRSCQESRQLMLLVGVMANGSSSPMIRTIFSLMLDVMDAFARPACSFDMEASEAVTSIDSILDFMAAKFPHLHAQKDVNKLRTDVLKQIVASCPSAGPMLISEQEETIVIGQVVQSHSTMSWLIVHIPAFMQCLTRWNFHRTILSPRASEILSKSRSFVTFFPLCATSVDQ